MHLHPGDFHPTKLNNFSSPPWSFIYDRKSSELLLMNGGVITQLKWRDIVDVHCTYELVGQLSLADLSLPNVNILPVVRLCFPF
jgi:hypothetical protein